MSCALAVLASCFSLAGFYVDGGVSVHDSDIDYVVVRHDYEWIANSGYQLLDASSNTNYARNPYGRIALGYEIKFNGRQLTVALEAVHESSIADAHDRGVNSLVLHARWYPFGGSQ